MTLNAEEQAARDFLIEKGITPAFAEIVAPAVRNVLVREYFHVKLLAQLKQYHMKRAMLRMYELVCEEGEK